MEVVFDRFSNPQMDAQWVEAYLTPLNAKFMKRYERVGTCGGLNEFMMGCVELGLMEAMFALAKRPRNDVKTIVSIALDIVHTVISLAQPSERQYLLVRAATCEGLNKCLEIMENHELCLDRYAAARGVQALAVELTWAHLLTSTEAGEVIERLMRQIARGADSFSEELRKPDRMWQVSKMIDRNITDPQLAAEYGKRWFGITTELCIFAVHSLVCVEPRHTRQFLFEVAQSHPKIIDLLLDCAATPRDEAYPDDTTRQFALEVLVLLVYWPRQLVPGVDISFEHETEFDCQRMKEKIDSNRRTSLSSIGLLVSSRGWREKILTIWSNIEHETPEQIAGMLRRVIQRAWGGMSVDNETILQIYTERGYLRILALHIITAVTHLPSVDTGDLISFLPIAFLATKRGGVFAADIASYTPRSARDLQEHAEQVAAISRSPLSRAHFEDRNPAIDPQCTIPELIIAAPTALMRLLVVLAERSLFEQIPTWTALPTTCAANVSLAQVKQITSPAVISQLLPLVFKRVVTQRETSRRNVNSTPLVARDDYRIAAELAAALIAFDSAVGGKWRGSMRGTWKELVLSLGNAAEMSNRVGDFETALGFSIAAMYTIERIPPDAEVVNPEVKQKNLRRWRTAREELQRRGS